MLIYRSGNYPDLAPDGKTFTKRPIPVLEEAIDYEAAPARNSVGNTKPTQSRTPSFKRPAGSKIPRKIETRAKVRIVPGEIYINA